MGSNGLSSNEVVLTFTFILLNISLVVTEEYNTPPKSEVPFHNLIPRFKMPRGNLLRYQIPQWEVLYFLKYGIVPFIFYDPNFNRTNFVTQVHKFKMYFDDGKPNRTSQSVLRDDEAFKEFLKNMGHPNYNKLPQNALKQNNKMMEEINGLLRAVSNGNSKTDTGNENLSPPLAPLDILMSDLEPGALLLEKAIQDPRKRRLSQKRSVNKEQENNTRIRQSFWDTFIYRYPLTWKYRKSMLLGNHRGFLSDQNPSWNRGSFPYSVPRLVSLSDLRRYIKSSRIGTRTVNMEGSSNSAQDDGGMPRSGGGNEPRRSGKQFQTQGWR